MQIKILVNAKKITCDFLKCMKIVLFLCYQGKQDALINNNDIM